MRLFILILSLMIASTTNAQRVGIGDQSFTPHASAMLHINSNDKGFLMPRVDSMDRMAIANPATGLVLFDTDYKRIFMYQQNQWISLADESMLGSQGGYWQKSGDTVRYTNGPALLNGAENTAALIFDDGQASLHHSYNTFKTSRQWLNIFLDRNADQGNAHFALFNDIQTNDGDPVVKFNLDGQDSWINSGDVGIGLDNPEQRLDINGAIAIGDANLGTLKAGTIRWNDASSDFEGWNGNHWLSLTHCNQTTGNIYTGPPAGDPMCCEIQYSPNNTNGLRFGEQLALHGDYAAISNFDEVFVIKNDNGTWLPDTTFYMPDFGSGAAVAMDSNFLVIGDRRYNGSLVNQGAVFVWQRVGNNWIVRDTIFSPVPIYNEQFGKAVTIDGQHIVVMTNVVFGDTLDVTAYIYKQNANTGKWNFKASFISPLTPNGEFASSVKISNNRVILRASETMYFYHLIGNVWGLYQTVAIPNISDFDICGDYALAARSANDFAAIIFHYENGTWVTADSLYTQEPVFPFSCDLSGDYAILGASDNYGETFHFDGADWNSTEVITDPLAVPGDVLGKRVAIDGVNRLMTAPFADPNGIVDHGKVLIGPVVQ